MICVGCGETVKTERVRAHVRDCRGLDEVQTDWRGPMRFTGGPLDARVIQVLPGLGWIELHRGAGAEYTVPVALYEWEAR